MRTATPRSLAPTPGAAGILRPVQGLARRRRGPVAILAATEAAGPVLCVGVFLALVVASGLAAHHGNATAFVRFGHRFAGVIRPPHGAVIYARAGYDGQYFYALTRDPLLLHASTLQAFADQSFRLQRIAYPAAAAILSLGRRSAIPWVLVGLNVTIVLTATGLFSRYARSCGRSGWWGLAAGLLPGLMYAVLGDLSDALAVTAMLWGLTAWRRQRRYATAGLLAVAVLAREPMFLAVIAIAGEGVVSAWHARAWRAEVERRWPALVVPSLAFVAWQLYIADRVQRSTSAPGTAFSAPFAAVVTEVNHALANASVLNGAWDLLYLALMLVGIALAVRHARREPSAPALAALMFALILPVLTFGYAWSYTRLSAPMFACLLLIGTERRARGVLGVCAVVAALGALVPLSVG